MARKAAVQQRERRIAALRRLVLWEGKLSRARIVELHDLSPIRASQWLREFRDACPDWLVWEHKSKCYVATEACFSEAARNQRLTRDLGQLSLSAYLPETHVATDFGEPDAPRVAVLPWSWSPIQPKVFSGLRMAIEKKAPLELAYRSMATPEVHKRTIEPHSLVRAGSQWHVRGYCWETGDFRNFLLRRISAVRAIAREGTMPIPRDDDWAEVVKVRIVPHPRLTAQQQDVVRSEYLGGTTSRVEACRGAMIPYLVQELRLAVDVAKQLPPEYELAIQAPEVVKRWLSPA
jgi:hypothetical protein